MSANGSGKQPPGDASAPSSDSTSPTQEQRMQVAMQVFDTWTQKTIAEINVLSILLGAQTTKVMLTLVADVLKAVSTQMKGVLGLPKDFRDDLQFADSIAKRIEAHLNGAPHLVVAPANTKIGGKPV